jgi:hypothetical protein
MTHDTPNALALPPVRVQLRRAKGWRKPEGAIVVARPTKWGNPFTLGDAKEWAGATDDAHARRIAVAAFRDWIGGGIEYWQGDRCDNQRTNVLRDLHVLTGYDLACWCPLDQPCHADVLLEMANRQ